MSNSVFLSAPPSFGARVVVRFSRSGWAWALRAQSPRLNPAPASLSVPFPSFASASAWACAVSASCPSFRVFVRRGSVASAWRAVGAPPAPPWAVKVVFSASLSARAARAALPPLAGL